MTLQEMSWMASSAPNLDLEVPSVDSSTLFHSFLILFAFYPCCLLWPSFPYIYSLKYTGSESSASYSIKDKKQKEKRKGELHHKTKIVFIYIPELWTHVIWKVSLLPSLFYLRGFLHSVFRRVALS